MRPHAKPQNCSRPAASSHRWQVLIAAQRGDRETALREAQLEPDEGYRRFELALAHTIRGDRQAADAALADLIANGRDQLAYQIARGLRRARRERQSVRMVANRVRSVTTPERLTLLVDPLLRGLRDDARYKNLLVKVGLPTTP